jgi:hypothetical protein
MELHSKCFITYIPHAACFFYPNVLCPIFMCISTAMENDHSDVTLSDLQRCEIEGSDSGKFENSRFMHQQPLHLLIHFLTFDVCACVRAFVRGTVWASYIMYIPLSEL